MPLAGLLAAVFGGLWLCLWRGRLRWLGLPLFLVALVTPGLDDPPDLIADGRARLFALRDADGRLALSSRSVGRYAGGVWLRRNGQDTPASWPAAGMRCDSMACIGEVRGRVAAFVFDSRALAEDCRLADVIVGSVAVGRSCRAPVVIDRFDLFCKGAHALYFTSAGVRVETARELRGLRPWTRRAPPWCGETS
jgi:competence protein ComEC